MTAQEMFYKLDFVVNDSWTSKEYAQNYLRYENPILTNDYYQKFMCIAVVMFDKKAKTVSVFYDYFEEGYEEDEPIEIDMPLLKAINQQVKELGWLDE